MIPVWGSVRSANAHFANREYGWGAFEFVLGGVDLFPGGALVGRGVKAGGTAAKAGVKAVAGGAKTAGMELAEQAGKAAVRTAAREGVELGTKSLAKQGAKQGVGLIGCFPTGTPILTPNGHINVEDLREGDLVLAAPEDRADGPIEPRRIMQTVRRLAPILNLHVADKVIRTTAEHPFYVYGFGWVPAGELHIGDFVRTHDDRWMEIAGIADSGEYTTVYNAEVEEYHTYFVGAREWGFSIWAHNNNPCWQAVTKGWTYTQLRKLTAGLGSKFVQVHHLIEKRFASLFGQKARDMLAQIVTKEQHDMFTKRWRDLIPRGAGTEYARSQGRAYVEGIARKVYEDFPDILKLLGL